jgi:hypothetical protein
MKKATAKSSENGLNQTPAELQLPNFSWTHFQRFWVYCSVLADAAQLGSDLVS